MMMRTQWQLYKCLEQIPDSISESQPSSQETGLTRWLRSMVSRLGGKAPEALNLEHLERCWAIDLTATSPVHPNPWQQWWQSLQQSFSLQSGSITAEPQVWSSVDSAGQTWWHVYSPRTGERADLASEEEVCLWIEQSFYR